MIEAWSSRLRGGRLEVADAIAAQARELLGDFAVISMEVRVLRHQPASLPAWRVVAASEPSKSVVADIADLAGDLLLFGPKQGAIERAAQLLDREGIAREAWGVEPYLSWSDQMRRRAVLIPVTVTLAATTVGIALGYLCATIFGRSTAGVVAPLCVIAGGVLLMVVAATLQIGARQRAVKVTALAILIVGIVAVLCGPTWAATMLGQPWVSPAALGVVLLVLAIQALVGVRAYARMRMSASKFPIAVVLAALGLTLFVLILNVPIALFYNAARELQLIGTTSWGTVLGTGVVFAGALLAATLSAWWALARWRSYATLFRMRLLLGLLATGFFAFFAFITLGVSITDGQLAREGGYGTQAHAEWMFPVCIADPKTNAEHTPLWLMGTDGRTTVLFDRSRMTGQSPAKSFPHYLDASRQLKYVDADIRC